MATTTITKFEGAPATGAAFNVAAPMHGASVGKHSTEGRNEELVAAQKTIWGLPPFTTGTGMSGRY